jgi:hypothetical protein
MIRCDWFIRFVGDTSAANTICDLQVNNITTNYHKQQLRGQSTTLSAARSTNSEFVYARSNIRSQGFVDIKVSNNDRFVAQSQYVNYLGGESSGIEQFNINIVNTGTVSSITSLKIVSSRTNGIAVGSKIALYKVTEAA